MLQTNVNGYSRLAIAYAWYPNVKARRFSDLFETFPIVIKDAWAESQTLPRGIKRERETEIINATFDKDGKGKLVVNDKAPLFKEFVAHSQNKIMTKASGGQFSVFTIVTGNISIIAVMIIM